MAHEPTRKPVQPYKFLDYYTKDDRELFFGRRRETEVLLADIISARLVVLFAKTGRGKSSLINAGVRPRLEDLDYDTAFIRVGLTRAPSVTAREALGLRESSLPFAEQLFEHVNRRRKPLVLFFDQFEEFFLFVWKGGSRERDAAEEFVRNTGAIYRQRDSGVHIVFSLREDFLAEMDVFSSEIPTIFHNDSKLRLRPLDDSQAREIIEGPATRVSEPFTFAPGVVQRIIDDLPPEEGGVGPAALQIVCDTLWRSMRKATIDDELYDSLGGAIGILERRLVRDLESLTDEESDLFVELIPLLRTKDGTKQIRSGSDLTSLLGTSEVMAALLRKLIEMRLLRQTTLDGELYVEWVSDYLAELSDSLESSAHLRALHRQTVDRARLFSILTDRRVLPALSSGDWERLLQHTLAHGETIALWHSRAAEHGHDVWSSIRKQLTSAAPPERNQPLIEFLGDLGTGEAVSFLGKLLDDSRYADKALRVLSTVRSADARALVKRASRRPDLRDAAVIAEQAGNALAAAVRSSPSPEREVAPSYRSMWSEVDWDVLIDAIRRQECLPVLGPGALAGYVPTRSQLAHEWSKRFDVPFGERNFTDVATYLSVMYRSAFPHRLLVDSIHAAEEHAPVTAIHRLLAALRLPLYLTTNIDDSQQRALREAGLIPRVEVLRWRQSRRGRLLSSELMQPRRDEPLVVHLYGHMSDQDSLVMTSDDHLEWLTEVSTDRELISPYVRKALTSSVVMFLGLAPMDPAYNTLFHFIAPYLGRGAPSHVMTLLPPMPEASTEEELSAATRMRDYIERYLTIRKIRPWWGTISDFAQELEARWRMSMR